VQPEAGRGARPAPPGPEPDLLREITSGELRQHPDFGPFGLHANDANTFARCASRRHRLLHQQRYVVELSPGFIAMGKLPIG